MSRIGRKPIALPAGVEVKVDNDNNVTVKGPLGTLSRTVYSQMKVKIDGSEITIERPDDEKTNRAMHGLTRTLISNMVIGVSNGFTKELEINGVGYRAAKNGNVLALTLGYSHPVEMYDTEDVTIEVPAPNKIIVKGIDKQKVGAFAANIREKRPPEPYKGKGVKYSTEVIKRKEGKTGGKK